MIRTIGLLLLSGTICASGFLLAERFKKRYSDTEYLLMLVCHLKREICIGKTKLSDCFSIFEEKKHQNATRLLEGRLFEEALSELSLTQRTKHRLLPFFMHLGKGDTEEEALRCEQVIEFLKEENRTQKESLVSTVKVCRTLGVCIAGVVLLLFL
jgi:stage III sporulation protein AB